MKKALILTASIIFSLNVFGEYENKFDNHTEMLRRNKFAEYVEDRRNGVYSADQQRIGTPTTSDPTVGNEPLGDSLLSLAILAGAYIVSKRRRQKAPSSRA